jgi:CSLREA domain-containing protein
MRHRFALPMLLSLGLSAQAATITMDVPAASTGCNLRNALQTANTNVNVSTCRRQGSSSEPDTIIMLDGNYETNHTLPYIDEDANARGDYDVLSEVIIQGTGVAISSLAGAELDRLFDVHSGASLTIRDTTLFGGTAIGTVNPVGGTIYKRNGGSLILERVVVRGGSAERGGAIFASTETGTLSLNGVTIRGGYAIQNGGGIALSGSGSPPLSEFINATFSGNTAASGSAIHASFTPLRLRSNTITANRASTGGALVYNGTSPAQVSIGNSLIVGNVNDSGAGADLQCTPNIQLSQRVNSVIGASAQCTFSSTSGTPPAGDVRLMPLFDYGSGVFTHALNHGSSAINAGTASGALGCPSTDARGVVRNGTCDIGAFELRFDVTVNSFADLVDAVPGDGQCRTSTNVCTLRAATMEANATGGRWFVAVPAGTYTLSPRAFSGNDDRAGDLDIRPDDDDTPPLAFTLFGLGDPGDTHIVGGGSDRVLESRARFEYTQGEGFVFRNVATALANVTFRGGYLDSDPFVPQGAEDFETPAGGGVYILGGHSLIYNVVIRDNQLRPIADRGQGAGLSVRVFRRQHSSSRWFDSEARVERFAVVDNVGAGDASLPMHVSGGGVFAAGPDLEHSDGITLVNGTIAGNRADAISGLYGSQQVYGAFLTIHDNRVPVDAAPSPSARSGIVLSTTEHLLLNSIVSGNLDGSTPRDCSSETGSIISAGYVLIGNATGCTVTGDTSSNLLNTAPQLGARETSASGMPFHRLAQNSPAANLIPRAACGDHRGFGAVADVNGADRPQGAGCEIGAVEGLAASVNLFANGFE